MRSFYFTRLLGRTYTLALATLDIINVLKRELRERGIPASTLSALAGIPSGKLSAYLNGVIRCPNEHDIRLRKAWEQLRKLIEYATPLPLSYTRAGELQKCIDLMAESRLQIVVFVEQKEPEPETQE